MTRGVYSRFPVKSSLTNPSIYFFGSKEINNNAMTARSIGNFVGMRMQCQVVTCIYTAMLKVKLIQ